MWEMFKCFTILEINQNPEMEKGFRVALWGTAANKMYGMQNTARCKIKPNS